MTTTSKKLIPNKRFPEFEKSGEWVEKKLGDVVDILDNLRRPISKNNRIPGQYPYYGANGIMDYINDYIFDGTYLLLGEDGSVINQDHSPVMHIATGKFWVNNHAHVVKGKSQLYNLYFIYYALHNANIEGFVKGIPPKLNQENLKIIQLIISNIKEQQKIADFLSSVDELIMQEKIKLEKLNEYKKGLLQNLFPKENQKVPDLRFPEFKNSGEWEEAKLKEILKITTGNKNQQDKVENGIYPFFVRSEKVENINTYSYDGEAILTAGDGRIGEIFHYINGKFNFHQRVYMLSDFNANIYAKYIYYIFSRDFKKRALSMSAKNTVDSVRMDMISEMKILIPLFKEQQKIADFLSSVDELIIEQTTKLQLLCDNKKGLLQQLFPN